MDGMEKMRNLVDAAVDTDALLKALGLYCTDHYTDHYIDHYADHYIDHNRIEQKYSVTT